ncbi:hypothetical protein [Solicola sp. PLA-1-18]|uniref:hypothetical protein n=1 Tax=Solicola sp. PLA-1-18 TaxID=3380532 RepID=UPI003B764D03
MSGLLSGPSVDRLVLLLAVLAVGLVSWLFLRRRPGVLVVLWCVVAGFVPFWFGVTARVYIQPLTVVGALIIACAIGRTRTSLGWPDLAVGMLFVSCVAPVLIGAGTASSVFTIVTQWGLGYTVGRILPLMAGLDRVHLVAGAVAAAVGVGAVVEFVLGWNPFVELPVANELYAKWGNLQERGGIIRAEWAYGHSIALGACLALAVPLLLAARIRSSTRALLLVPIVAGAVVSFSRIGIVCTVAGIVLSVLFLPNDLTRRLRAVVAGVLVLGAVVATPIITSTFASAGSEATNSAAYRGNLSSLIPSVSIFGFSDAAQRTGSGELYFGRFQSIDSALILLGLTYGWVALVIAVGLLAAAGWSVVTRHATPATVAVVAHVPALVTVALITQYAIFFWFVVGVAVCTAVEGRTRGRDLEPDLLQIDDAKSDNFARNRSWVGYRDDTATGVPSPSWSPRDPLGRSRG